MVFHELVDNGFSHGCASGSNSVTVRAVVFKEGASVELINNNKSKKLPSREEIMKVTQADGLTGYGLRLVSSLADEIDVTRGGRGIKVVIYKKEDAKEVDEEGLTFIYLSGFSSGIGDRIDRALSGRSGDVIIVFGPEPQAATSTVRRAAGEVERKEFVGRFALVVGPASIRFLADLPSRLPKLVGCFTSREDAIAALRPGSPRQSGVASRARKKTERNSEQTPR
jgi:hypothetical protein